MTIRKPATIKRFEYSPLGSELKKQTGFTKDRYKFFKDQMNVIINIRKEDIKIGGDEIDSVNHSCIADGNKDLIEQIFIGWAF